MNSSWEEAGKEGEAYLQVRNHFQNSPCVCSLQASDISSHSSSRLWAGLWIKLEWQKQKHKPDSQKVASHNPNELSSSPVPPTQKISTIHITQSEDTNQSQLWYERSLRDPTSTMSEKTMGLKHQWQLTFIAHCVTGTNHFTYINSLNLHNSLIR